MSGHQGFIEDLGIERGPFGEGRSQLYIEIGPHHISPTKTVHGGVLYALADTTMGSALWTLMEDGETCATISCSIDYLRAVREGVIRCEAEVVSKGRRTAMARAIIRDSTGEPIAQAAASFFVGPVDERRAGKGQRRRAKKES
ncbi:MAG: PaaI family thioesterase [Actinomycetota bacterium]